MASSRHCVTRLDEQFVDLELFTVARGLWGLDGDLKLHRFQNHNLFIIRIIQPESQYLRLHRRLP